MRIRSLLPLTPLVLLTILSAGACKEGDGEIIEALRGDWTTTDVLERVEVVRFEKDRILWRYGTESQYECPWRPISHHPEGRKLDLRLRCKRRTGSDQWIVHRLLFNEDLSRFTMSHGEEYDIVDGVFVAAPE